MSLKVIISSLEILEAFLSNFETIEFNTLTRLSVVSI